MMCEYFEICGFMEHMNRTDVHAAHTVKMTYCEDDIYGCARYGLYQVLAAEFVPDYLWPNDEEEALELIKAKSRNKEKNP